jgi:BirA family biotin operon repressor/biotin-[acetyl-CoA-carboxylase] ligase
MKPSFTVTFHDALASTSDTAKSLAASGAPHGTTIAARQQTAGRGRLGRTWVSPPGNLHVSFLLRYAIPPARQAELGFAAALAVADLIDAHLPAGPRAQLKWPNDVLVDGQKIAGILLESDTSDDPFVVLGIGVNLAHAPPNLPYPVTSLAGLGAPPPAPEAALDLLTGLLGTRLTTWEQHGFEPIRAAWRHRGPAPGTPLRVTAGGTARAGAFQEGDFQDLAPDGALVLWTPDGCLRVTAGVVSC